MKTVTREVAQIRVKDGTAFDPWRSGLELARAGSAARPTGWIRLKNLDGPVYAGPRRGRACRTTMSEPKPWSRRAA